MAVSSLRTACSALAPDAMEWMKEKVESLLNSRESLEKLRDFIVSKDGLFVKFDEEEYFRAVVTETDGLAVAIRQFHNRLDKFKSRCEIPAAEAGVVSGSDQLMDMEPDSAHLMKVSEEKISYFVYYDGNGQCCAGYVLYKKINMDEFAFMSSLVGVTFTVQKSLSDRMKSLFGSKMALDEEVKDRIVKCIEFKKVFEIAKRFKLDMDVAIADQFELKAFVKASHSRALGRPARPEQLKGILEHMVGEFQGATDKAQEYYSESDSERNRKALNVAKTNMAGALAIRDTASSKADALSQLHAFKTHVERQYCTYAGSLVDNFHDFFYVMFILSEAEGECTRTISDVEKVSEHDDGPSPTRQRTQ